MRKGVGMKKILWINFIFLFLLFTVLEIYSYKQITKSFHPLHPPEEKLQYHLPKAYDYDEKKSTFQTIYPQNMKRPILLFGCSYVENGGVPVQDELAMKLSKKTSRIIYKRARSDTNSLFMYKQLQDKDFKLEVPDAEYIIYVFLRYHTQRNYRYTRTLFPSPEIRYKINKNNEFEEIKPFFTLPLYSLFTVKYIQDLMAGKKSNEERKNGNPFLLKILYETNEKLKQYYPESKFIVLEYPDGTYSLPSNLQYEDNIEERNLQQDTIKHISEMGIIYINAEELVGHQLRDLEYRHTDLEHPNGKAWEEVSSALVKRFNM